MEQQFCLKWNNHSTNMLQVFSDLLRREHFVDVTLACEGHTIKCHRMVLSACSPYFQSLFVDNPCKHPIVIMNNMRYVDLKAIVHFMYNGEVNVSQDQLSALLKTAETLKVKGLAEVTTTTQNKLAESSRKPETNSSESSSTAPSQTKSIPSRTRANNDSSTPARARGSPPPVKRTKLSGASANAQAPSNAKNASDYENADSPDVVPVDSKDNVLGAAGVITNSNAAHSDLDNSALLADGNGDDNQMQGLDPSAMELLMDVSADDSALSNDGLGMDNGSDNDLNKPGPSSGRGGTAPTRAFERHSTRQSWTEDDMNQAIELLMTNRLSKRAVSNLYKIPRTTLTDRCRRLRLLIPKRFVQK